MERTAAATQRNHQLDGLRGYAAMAVVVYHSILGLDTTQIQRILFPNLQDIDGLYAQATKIVLALFSGETAVVVFFVMSGAVLFASLKRETTPIGRTALAFAVRRVLRIYPTLIAFLLVALVVFPFFDVPSSIEKALINLSLTDFPMNGASWTLNVEMLAAPFIFAGYLGYRRWGEAGLIAVIVAILLIFKIKIFAGHLEFFRMFAFCFALGMLIPTKLGEFVGRNLPAMVWPILLIAMLFAKQIVIFGGHKTAGNVQQISAALLVTLLYYDNAGSLGEFLRRPISALFGRLSYTLYLFNVLFLETIEVVLRGYPWVAAHPLEMGLAAAVVILALTIPTAYLVTVWIEEPAIRLGRRLTRPARHDLTAEAGVTPAPS